MVGRLGMLREDPVILSDPWDDAWMVYEHLPWDPPVVLGAGKESSRTGRRTISLEEKLRRSTCDKGRDTRGREELTC